MFDFANYNRFQKNLRNGQPNEWQCRAGARYLYVCEDGLVHWCSQQRGHPGIRSSNTACEDLRSASITGEGLRATCTVGCVHRVAQVDELREEAARTHCRSGSGLPTIWARRGCRCRSGR